MGDVRAVDIGPNLAPSLAFAQNSGDEIHGLFEHSRNLRRIFVVTFEEDTLHESAE